MTCKDFLIRTKNYKYYFFCKNKRCEITYKDCQNCSEFNFKRNKAIKKKSTKLAKLEKNRTSILQEDNTMCFLCNKKIKLDKHEAFGGPNRQKSIKWELVYYLCRECHSKADLDKQIRQYLHDYAREKFIKKYSEELFLKEFGKKYLEGK